MLIGDLITAELYFMAVAGTNRPQHTLNAFSWQQQRQWWRFTWQQWVQIHSDRNWTRILEGWGLLLTFHHGLNKKFLLSVICSTWPSCVHISPLEPVLCLLDLATIKNDKWKIWRWHFSRCVRFNLVFFIHKYLENL